MELERKTSSSTESLSRTRTWSADMQKYWNLPVPDVETIDQRVARYKEYFSMRPDQVAHVCDMMVNEMRKCIQTHSSNPTGAGQPLRMLDSCYNKLPTGNEKGVVYTVEFSSSQVRAARCRLDGNKKITTSEYRTALKDVPEARKFLKGLLDGECDAMALFDTIAETVRVLMESFGELGKKQVMPVAFVVPFPCEQTELGSACLLNWTKGFETGRFTSDPVESLDMGTLLDMAFWRKEMNAKCVTVVNDATATLAAAEYERQPKMPPTVAAFMISIGVNGAYVEPNAKKYGYVGSIINTEIGDYDKGLPMTDVDLEVDFADQGGHGRQLLEKMIGGGYLGEVCRRLIVKVYQSDAPTLAWARQSLPTAAAALCASDDSEDLERCRSLLKGLWDWDLSKDDLLTIKDLFRLVFDRSAALSAAIIGAMAKNTSRLQPAMGGLTVALEGSLHSCHPWYTELIRERLNTLLEHNARLVQLFVTHDATVKGAAVVAAMSQTTPH